jgi:hypothetical protein
MLTTTLSLLHAALARLWPDSEMCVSEDTLKAIQRDELRVGWDRDAHHCGPWQGELVTEAARTLKWRETR